MNPALKPGSHSANTKTEIEKVVQLAANVMDHKTGTEIKSQFVQDAGPLPFGARRGYAHVGPAWALSESEVLTNAEERVRSENITELCKRKRRIEKTFSPRVSAEISFPENTEEFMNAATQGKLNVVDKYLADGGNPNVHDELKRTALHRASLQGHIAVVQMLLENGADINFKDQLGSRAIHWACRGGSLEVIKALNSHGADLNIRDKLYSTPLHVATRTGQIAIVEYLLSGGAKINSRDREGDTALHDAVRLNRYKIVKLLISAGADTKIKNHAGVTAVQQVKQWQFDIMETLQRLEKLREVLPENTLMERSE